MTLINEENQRNNQLRLPKKATVKLSIVSSGGGFLFGYDIGVIAGALEQLSILFNLSCFQQEMIVSSLFFGALFGSLFGGYFIDKCGRKVSILLSSVLYFLGGVILSFANSYGIIILGRIVLGVAMALASASECVYVSELAPQVIRGSLVSLNEFGITVGILFSYIINLAFANNRENGWRFMFGLSTLGAGVVFATVLLLPKSPRYLLMKSNSSAAKLSLFSMRLHGKPEQADAVEKEFEIMEQNFTMENHGKLCNRTLVYPICIAVGLVMIQQLSGEPNVLLYANTILLTMGFHNDIVASLGTVSLGIAKVIATVLCLYLVDKVGRKKFLLTGCIIMSVCIFALSAMVFELDIDSNHLCTNNSSVDPLSDASNISYTPSTALPLTDDSSKWVALVLLVLYVAAYSVSFGPVTWIILSEIFPRQIRGRLFSFATCLNWLMNLLLSSTYLEFVKVSGGLGWPFMVSGMVTLVSVVIVYVAVPETKGKSLEDITALMNRGFKCNGRLSCFGKSDAIATPLILEEI